MNEIKTKHGQKQFNSAIHQLVKFKNLIINLFLIFNPVSIGFHFLGRIICMEIENTINL